jgi:exonuclease III
MRIATINTQSIADQARRSAVYPTFRAWDLDILALQETWLREKEAAELAATIFHASNGARTFSTVAPETDHRHLGVTLILEEQLARHHQHTDAFGGTAIRVKLRWKRREMHIIATYVPPRSTRADNAALAKETIDKVTR